MRSLRDAAVSTNLDGARRLVRSLVGVLDVAFRVDADGRIEGVAVLPAPGVHERQVRLNVASGLMAGFGVALDPMKIELASSSGALRAIEPPAEARSIPGPARPATNGVAPVPEPAEGLAAPKAAAPPPSGPAPAANGAAQADPPRPVLKPRVTEGTFGLAARALQKPQADDRPAAADAPAARPSFAPHAEPRVAATPRPEPAPTDEPPVPAWPETIADVGPARRVRLVDDDREPAAASADVRPFPAPPGEANAPAAAQSAPAPYGGAAGRVPAGFVTPVRGGAAAALALPVEPAPAPPRTTAAPSGAPALEVAEVVASRGATVCRVVITHAGETYTGVAEVPEAQTDTLQLVARITADALRSARFPREPIQFHGVTTTDVAGRPFAIAVLRAWNGRAFDDLTGVAPVHESPEEAAALAVLKAAASRNA